MKKVFNSLLSHGIAVVIGFAIAISLAVYAATQVASSQVSYSISGSDVTDVQGALDELYYKLENTSSDCAKGYAKGEQTATGGYECEKLLCVRATTLHTETCQNGPDSFCAADGYAYMDTITYGNLGTTGTLATGDAFDCDVNDDGTYDPTTERFYYVSTKNNGIVSDANTAVLIYYNNTVRGQTTTEGSKWTWRMDGTGTMYGPETARGNLPTESQWNTRLTQTTRDITYENNNVRVANFDYSGYAARLLTYQEANQGCYDGTTDIKSDGGISTKCKFLMENTKYSKSSNPTYGPYLETPSSKNSTFTFLVDSTNRRITDNTVSYTENGARPAIEVSLSKISY